MRKHARSVQGMMEAGAQTGLPPSIRTLVLSHQNRLAWTRSRHLEELPPRDSKGECGARDAS
jgi:hypothetical protein